MRWIRIAVAMATAFPHGAHAQPTYDPRYVQALSKLYTTARLGGLVKEWCDARAPDTAPDTDVALAAWKRMHRLDDVEANAAEVLGTQRMAVEELVAARRASVFGALDKESKAPAADCRQMLEYLDRSANPQRLHPLEFQLFAREFERSRSVAARAATATPGSTIQAGNNAGVSGATFYTVAQLSSLVARDRSTASARLRQLEPLVVRGTLETYDEDVKPDSVFWLNTLADGWRSTMSVRCHDLSFRRLYDEGRREITLQGRLRSVDSWIVLDDCKLLAGATSLTASTLDESQALRRLPATREQIVTAPNRGVTMAQIEGVYQPSALRFNPMSLLYEPDETTYLVLRDGWLYDKLSVSPHDLDVAQSRRLEPQHWHRWRRTSTGLEVQKHDERGRTDGRWSPLKLIERPTIGARKLDGTFSATSSATAGLIGGGGATSIGTTTYTFRPDGSFSWSNFTQNFASSSGGTGPDGRTIVAGGTVVGPGGTFSSSVGGGDDAGTYTTNGYTLELRTRSGKVLRFPIFSWDTGEYRDFIVINGTTYSPPD